MVEFTLEKKGPGNFIICARGYTCHTSHDIPSYPNLLPLMSHEVLQDLADRLGLAVTAGDSLFVPSVPLDIDYFSKLENSVNLLRAPRKIYAALTRELTIDEIIKVTNLKPEVVNNANSLPKLIRDKWVIQEGDKYMQNKERIKIMEYISKFNETC